MGYDCDGTVITERSLAILKSLVDRYIREGQPVGSKALAQESHLMLSSASIRSIMADLEAAGLLKSPHTSAGRIPTTKGLRLFIDHFVTMQPMLQQEIEQVRQQFEAESDVQQLIANASLLISNVTRLAGMVTMPKREQLILKHVEFLRLSAHRILVVLVFNNQEVQNRVIHTNRGYLRSELEQAGNYLTAHFGGKDLLNVRDALMQEMKQDHHNIQEMIRTVMEMTEKTTTHTDNFLLSGEIHLLDAVEESSYQQLKPLFKAFYEKRNMVHLLDRVLQADGVKLFIGEESGYKVLDDYSIVAAPYSENGRVVGVLGVIGPTRMHYDKVISVVDVTAKLLSQALNMDN